MGIGGSSRIYWVSQFPGKLSYDDEIATSWLSCKLGLSRTKAQWGLGCYQVYRARHTLKSQDQRAECPEGRQTEPGTCGQHTTRCGAHVIGSISHTWNIHGFPSGTPFTYAEATIKLTSGPFCGWGKAALSACICLHKPVPSPSPFHAILLHIYVLSLANSGTAF